MTRCNPMARLPKVATNRPWYSQSISAPAPTGAPSLPAPLGKGGKRILLLGSGGSGKTTFALRLAALTGLPVVHLDAHYWRPHWTEPDKPTWRAQVAALTEQDTWIMDGNYLSSLDLRLPRADAVFFFDIPNWHCLWNILKRRLRYAGQTRPDMAPGCPETIDFAFVWWVWRYPRRDKVRVFEALDV